MSVTPHPFGALGLFFFSLFFLCGYASAAFLPGKATTPSPSVPPPGEGEGSQMRRDIWPVDNLEAPGDGPGNAEAVCGVDPQNSVAEKE